MNVLTAGYVVRILLAVVVCATLALVVLVLRPFPTEHAVVVPPQVQTVAAPKASLRPAGFQGSLSCAATACHGATLGNEVKQSRSDFVARAYSQWAEYDPHAGAYRTLNSDLSQRMVQALTGAAHGTPAYAEALNSHCFGCHAPLAAEPSVHAADLMTEGVSCEACHGSAEKWLLSHVAGGSQASEGMNPTKPLLDRAQVCATCHVGTGTAGQEVNHDMLAAGHPRLQFEFRAYHEALPKHWQPTVLDTNAAEAWNAGQFASGFAAVHQFAQRKEHGSIWPEFAEMDCYACHRSLTVEPNDNIASPGVPSLQQWYLLAPQNDTMPLAAYIPNMNRSLADPTVPLGFATGDVLQNSPNSTPQYVPLVEQLKQVEQQTAAERPTWEVHAVLWLLASTIEAEARHQLATRSNEAEAGSKLALLETARAELAKLLPSARQALSPPSKFQAGSVQRELIDQAQQVGQLLEELGDTP